MENTAAPSTVTRQHQSNRTPGTTPAPTNRPEPPHAAIRLSFPPILERHPRILEFVSYPFGVAGIFCMANHRYLAGISLLTICIGLAGTSAFIQTVFDEHYIPAMQQRLRRIGRLP